MSDLLHVLQKRAAERGLDAVGVAPARPVPSFERYQAWVDAGHHGTMGYMAREPSRRADPDRLLPGTRSVVVVAANHRTREPAADLGPLHGRVARYAWNRDYHDAVLDDLEALAADIRRHAGGNTRAYVDTGAILERDAAQRAGLGFIAKNTMLIRPGLGSHVFLGEILATADIEPSGPDETAGCGQCRICLDACPTGAIVEPYVVDARRCISYLTIELRGPIPRALRPALGRWVFGCDICQDCCPWNATVRSTERADFQPRNDESVAPHLPSLLALDDEAFRRRFAGTPLLRPKRRGLLRNACVALGNEGNPQAVPALVGALSDGEPLVRGHAAWALGAIAAAGGSRLADSVGATLEQAAARERDAAVLEEITLARGAF